MPLLTINHCHSPWLGLSGRLLPFAACAAWCRVEINGPGIDGEMIGLEMMDPLIISIIYILYIYIYIIYYIHYGSDIMVIYGTIW